MKQERQNQIINDLIEEVKEKGHHFGYNGIQEERDLPLLRNELLKWLGIPGKNTTNILWRVSAEDGNIIVIVEEKDIYLMGRWFMAADEWKFSMDKEGAATEVMERMLQVL